VKKLNHSKTGRKQMPRKAGEIFERVRTGEATTFHLKKRREKAKQRNSPCQTTSFQEEARGPYFRVGV